MNRPQAMLSLIATACLAAPCAGLARGAEPGSAPRRSDAAGRVRQMTSDHLRLSTDLSPGAEVDALPKLFDQAFAAWCEYFQVDPAARRSWSVRATLMKSREDFASATELPEFASGYSRGNELWLVDQPSDYYRRHLLLHEGTHVFMDTVAGGKGPPWLAEGLAELLATHRVHDGRLTLNVVPRSREEVPKWGRIEMIAAARSDGRALSLEQIFAFDTRASLDNQSYAWCWAAAVFFDHQDRYRSRFRELARAAGQEDFTRRFQNVFADDWPRIRRDWKRFVADLDYGYDFDRNTVDFRDGAELPERGTRVEIAADRSWQSAGVRLDAGATYRLRASGRYQVAAEPRAWWCEPGGVTIRYYRGQPLGILLAAVAPENDAESADRGLLDPIVVGLEKSLVAPRSGTLYLRINDSGGSLGDNSGTLLVEIERQ